MGTFIFMMIVTAGALLVAVLTAFIGFFSYNEDTQNRLYAISAKSIIIFALAFVVGFGACLGSI